MFRLLCEISREIVGTSRLIPPRLTLVFVRFSRVCGQLPLCFLFIRLVNRPFVTSGDVRKHAQYRVTNLSSLERKIKKKKRHIDETHILFLILCVASFSESSFGTRSFEKSYFFLSRSCFRIIITRVL